MHRYLILMISIFALSLTFVSAQTDGESLTVRLGEVGISTLDPIFVADTSEQQALHSMYVGLTRYDLLTNTLQPGLAESWTRTFLPNDTVLYRFQIRNDIPWVRYDHELGQVVKVLDDNGNPRMVTKEDVAYGILRAMNPEFATDYSYTLSEAIYNGVDYLNGDASADEVGVYVNLMDVAIASANLDVDIAHIMSQTQVLPQPTWLIEEFGLDWATPDNFVSYGPYALYTWNELTEMTLVLNPYWVASEGIPKANIDNLYLTFMGDDDARLAYSAGEIDVLVNPAPADILSLSDEFTGELDQYPRDTVYVIGFNLRENFPTANPQFRQALTQAINRDALAEINLSNGTLPATRYLPPTVSDAPNADVQVLPYNTGQAQADFSEANLEDTGIDLIYRNTDELRALAEAVAEQWQSELGIEVRLSPQDYDGSFTNREFVAVWMGEIFSDEPLSKNYFGEFVTGGDFSVASSFSDENYDTAFDVVYGDEPIEDPAEFFRVMETTLLEDAIIVPMSWSADTEFTKPYVQRTPTVNGIRAFETWFVQN